jgi:hypothetical protein
MSYEKIVELVFECGGFVFGGYVRDMLSGAKNGNDIDVCFNNTSSMNEFIAKLAMTCSVKPCETETEVTDVLASKYGGKVVKLEYAADQWWERIDILVGSIVQPDFDVNMLMYNRNGISLAPWSGSLNIWKVISNIKNLKCEPLKASTKRRDKMREKGWTITDEPSESIPAYNH